MCLKIKTEEPPVIVESSNNNQAVTNIIDSLGKLDNDDNILAKRWLLGVESFGMYIVSKGEVQGHISKEYFS